MNNIDVISLFGICPLLRGTVEKCATYVTENMRYKCNERTQILARVEQCFAFIVIKNFLHHFKS